MADLHTFYEEHGATFESVADREVVATFRRPDRTHRAVRNGVGVIEHPVGVIVVEGTDRLEYVDNVVTNTVPTADGEGCYAFLLDPSGRIETDLKVLNAGDRLLLLTAPGQATPTAEGWETFIQDVSLSVATDRFAAFGVHGPAATETVTTVLTGTHPPEQPFRFVRGSIHDAGVTVIRDDDLIGEPGYVVVCSRDEAVAVVDDLVNRGPAAVPFGRRTWTALTLEAGTPLFEFELEGHIPNDAGLDAAIDYEKGCYVGQEVVSRIENRGGPGNRLVGLRPSTCPEPRAAVMDSAGDAVGTVTRAIESPILDSPIALAYVDFGVGDDLSVAIDGEVVSAERDPLPFVATDHPSGRLPQYD